MKIKWNSFVSKEGGKRIKINAKINANTFGPGYDKRSLVVVMINN